MVLKISADGKLTLKSGEGLLGSTAASMRVPGQGAIWPKKKNCGFSTGMACLQRCSRAVQAMQACEIFLFVLQLRIHGNMPPLWEVFLQGPELRAHLLCSVHHAVHGARAVMR